MSRASDWMVPLGLALTVVGQGLYLAGMLANRRRK